MARNTTKNWQEKADEYRRKQQRLERRTFRDDARAFTREARQNEKEGHIAGVGERANTSARLYQLSEMANSIRSQSQKRSQAYKDATRMLKEAYGAENHYRKSMVQNMQTQAQREAEARQQAMDPTGVRGNVQQLANSRLNTQVQRQQDAQAAFNAKYGDLSKMSATELKSRIANLENRIAENQARRATNGVSEQSTNTGRNVSPIIGYNNNMGTPEVKRQEQQVNRLTKEQLERLDRDNERANDYLQVYKKALPEAVAREEESKLSKEEKDTILRAAEMLRQDTRGVTGQGGTIIGNIATNMSPIAGAMHSYDIIKTADEHEELDPKIEELKKRGIDTDYLLDYYATYLDNKEAEKKAEEARAFADDMPILSSVLSVPANLVGGINAAGEDIRHAIRTSDDKPLPINQKNRELTNYAQNIRSKVSEGIDNSVWRFIYNAGMSTADSAAAILAGGVAGGLGKAAASRITQGIMSVGAADQTYNDAIERGLDPGHALLTGITAGVAEWVTEKYSIDGLKSMALKRPENLKNLVKNIGKQMVTEGSEEAASDVLNTISDNIINGKKSEFNQSMKKYREQGLTTEQARKAAMMDWIGGVAYDAAAGAFSGALMGAGGQAVSFRQTQNEISDYGDTLDKAGDKNNTLEYAKRFEDLVKMAENAKSSNKVGKVAEAIEKKVNERVKQAETPEELEAVYEELKEDAPDTVRIQIDSAVSMRAAELADKTSNKAFDKIYDSASSSFMETSDRVDTKIKETENETKNETPVETVREETQGKAQEQVLDDTAQESREGVSERTAKVKIQNHNSAVLADSGVPVTVDGFKNVGTNNVKLRIDGNDEVDLSDVHFENKSVEQLYRVAAHMDSEAAAAAMISNYDGKQNTARYVEEFEKAYNWGTTMMSYDNVRKQNAFIMPEHIIKTAYDLGLNQAMEDYSRSMQESNAISGGDVSFRKGSGEAIDERTDDFARGDLFSHIDQAIAKKLGVTVRSVDKIEGGRDMAGVINGYFDAGQAEMRFSELAESKLGVRIHEMMEFAEKMDPGQYKGTVGTVLRYALEKNGANDIYSEITKYREAYRDAEGSKTFAEAAEEYINDAISGAFMTEDGARDFIEWLGKENMSLDEKKGIIRTILDMINQLIEKIQDTLKMGGLTKAQQKTANLKLERQKMIRDLFKELLDSAAENYQGTKNGDAVGMAASRGYSLSTKTNLRFESVIDKYNKIANPQKGEAPRAEGFNPKEQENEIRVGKIIHNKYGDILLLATNNKDGYNPDYLFKGKLWDLKTPKKYGKIEARLRKGIHQIEKNPGGLIFDLSSLDRGKAENIIGQKLAGIEHGEFDLIIIYGEDIVDILAVPDNKTETRPRANAPRSASNNSIAQSQENASDNSEKSEKSYSLAVDTQGRELTKEQQEYFKNSVIRNAEGKLVPLYHQTAEVFTVFETKRRGAGKSDYVTPYGVFMKSTPNDIGLKGKNQMTLYANITNPIVARDRDELSRKLTEIFPEYKKQVDVVRKIDDDYSAKYKEAERATYEFMTKWVDDKKDRKAIYENNEFNELFEKEEDIIEEWGDKTDAEAAKAKEILTSSMKASGYDGIILANDSGSFGRSTDAYIALEPNQVKSIDNESPTENHDIRYSLAVDTEGRELSEGQKEFFKDSKVVDENGALKVVYHGSENDFTVFDMDMARGTEDIEAFFFSGDREEAEGYGNSREFYLNITNPADYDTAYNIFFKHKGETGAGTITREELEKLGYDGVIAVDEDAPEYTEYMVFHPEQIKLTSNLNPTENADIRYSLTDTKETADLVKENKHLKALVKNLEKEFELTGGELPNETKIKTAARNILKATNSKFDLDTLVENITNVYKYLRQEGADFEEATRVMSEIARGVLEKAEIVEDKHSEAYKDLREQIRKNGIVLSEGQRAEVAGAVGLGDYRKRNFGRMKIKKEGATTLDQQWQEWSSEYPELFPNDTKELDMPFVLEGVLDALQPEIQTLNGETIDQMAYDVAMQIYGELAKVPAKETFADKKEREKHEAILHVANTYEDLLAAYRKDVKAENEAEASEMEEQVKREKSRRIAKLQEEIETLGEAKKTARDPKTLEEYKKAIERKGAEIARLKQMNEKKIAELRQKYQSSRMKQTEQRRQTEAKNKIRKVHEKLRRMLQKPKEGNYVPDELINAAITVCESVNLGEKKGSQLFRELEHAKLAFEAAKMMPDYTEDDFDDRIKDDIDDLKEMINRFIEEKGEDWSIYDLSAADLNRLYETMNNVYEAIRLATQLIREEGEKDARRAGKRIIKDLAEVKGVKDNFWARTVERVRVSFLNSYREFRRLSGYKDDAEFMEIWKELNEGQRKMYNIQMEGERKLQETTTKKELASLMEELDSKKGLVKVPLRFESGNAPVMVTKGMRIALILHGRSRANRIHMKEGGLMIPARMDKYEKDKKAAYEKTRKVIGVSDAALLQMENELSSEERELLEAFEDFFNNWTGDKINETSKQLYGFNKARVKNYYPIRVDKDFTSGDIASALKFDKTIEGMGMLKERVQSANPMILESVIDTADSSLNNVAMFCGLAIPIRNFNKIMAVQTYKPAESEDPERAAKWEADTSVRREFKLKWGTRAEKFIQDMLADLQQARRTEASFYDKLRGNYAAAVLTANASVIIKQTSAYPTCAAITGWSPTIKAMFRGGKNNHPLSRADQELISKYTPIYWERNKGNSTRELAEIREYNVGLNKIAPVRMVKDAIQKVDMAMVGRFWYAAQYYIDSTRKDLEKGSDEYYREVAKVFDRCVEETQSTNMTLQNADIMRNPGQGAKLITMFMGQGLQNFGIVYDNFHNVRAKRQMLKDGKITKEVYTQARKDFVNAVSSQIVSAAMFSGLAIVARALLHRMNPYRDDDEEITGEKIVERWFDDMMENIIGSVPLGSLLYEWGTKLVTGERPYGQDDIVLGAINDFENSTIKLGKAIASGEGILDAFGEVAKDGSKLLGIPVENVMNLGNGLIQHVADVTSGNGFLSFETGKNKPVASKITAHLIDSIDKGDNQAVEAYTETLYELGKTAKDINSLIAKGLAEREDIIAAAEKKNAGDVEAYSGTVEAYVEKGFSRDAVVKAIDNLVKKMNEKPKEKPDPEQLKARALESGSYSNSIKTEEESLYKSSDLTAAVDKGDKRTIKTVMNEIIKEKTKGKKDKDEAKKKAISSIKTALTKSFKVQYMAAETAHDRLAVMKKLQDLSVDGVKIYNQKDFERWAKEYEKLS